MAPRPINAPTNKSGSPAWADDIEPSMKEMVLAAKEPSQTEIRALRPIIITAARATPAAGKIGEILPGGIVNRKLALAATAYTAASASMASADGMKRVLMPKFESIKTMVIPLPARQRRAAGTP